MQSVIARYTRGGGYNAVSQGQRTAKVVGIPESIEILGRVRQKPGQISNGIAKQICDK